MQVTVVIVLYRLIPWFGSDPKQLWTFYMSQCSLCFSSLIFLFLSSRFLFFHLWYPEEPRTETFPRAAGSSYLRQPQCPRSETTCKSTLWRRCRRHRSDNIVSAPVRWATSFDLKSSLNDERTTRLFNLLQADCSLLPSTQILLLLYVPKCVSLK